MRAPGAPRLKLKTECMFNCNHLGPSTSANDGNTFIARGHVPSGVRDPIQRSATLSPWCCSDDTVAAWLFFFDKGWHQHQGLFWSSRCTAVHVFHGAAELRGTAHQRAPSDTPTGWQRRGPPTSWWLRVRAAPRRSCCCCSPRRWARRSATPARTAGRSSAQPIRECVAHNITAHHAPGCSIRLCRGLAHASRARVARL